MSLKALDHKGRWRNITVAFRMSPEEDKQLEQAVALSGLTKQEYIVRRLQNREVKVVGNPRVFKALRGQLGNVLEELKRISCEPIDSDLQEIIYLIATTMNGMQEDA